MGEKKEALRREKRRKEPDSEARRDSVTVTCRNLKEPDESLKRGPSEREDREREERKGRVREKRRKDE